MLKITRETDYAMLIMCEMARQQPFNESMNASLLAEKTNITLSMVSKLLKLLVKSCILTSTRGPNGGYQMIKSADQLNAADIICAIEGPVSINNCATNEHSCDRSHACNLAPHWSKINQTIFTALSDVLLSDLIIPISGTSYSPKNEHIILVKDIVKH